MKYEKKFSQSLRNSTNRNLMVQTFVTLQDFKENFFILTGLHMVKKEPVSRMEYFRDINEWEFAIFKWSSEIYDPEECFSPGSELVDGTVEGAMKAGMRAYPV